jgi:hypothetical protein
MKRHLGGVDIDLLAGRARAQHARVEAQRLVVACRAFG